MGLGTGGVMKTSNAGASFSGVFDKEGAAAIGDIAIAPSDPKVVWVGTGEANDRNSSSWGDGVYRSADSGETWTNVGLGQSRTIARITVHPTDPNVAWVAATGDLWQPGGERGLFKTGDGGKTWKKTLGGEGTAEKWVGCGDVALDLADPNVLYAALYARRRTPWSFTYGASLTDGKDAGGIFKSTDGGATWRKLTKGLPGLTGRIGLDVSRKNPHLLYAIVQSDEGGTSGIDDIKSRAGGVYRSDDAGESWTRVNPLNPRPFYFSQIRVDPIDDKRVYVLGFMLHVSDDGGVSFREDLFEKVHPDCHALAIDPAGVDQLPPDPESKNPRRSPRLLIGTDGGIYQSFDGGGTWDHLNRFAAGEYYRITLDDSVPYRIAGGLQDNLNWVGPSRTRTKEGIQNSDWVNVGGGDGFYCVFDPDDRDVVYAESQEGYVHRFNMRTGELKMRRPEPTEGQPANRFHWNSPLIGSVHARGTMYLAGNRVFKLTERAEKFTVISPDLSTRDLARMVTTGSGAENYGVVYTLAESPAKAGLLWAGTDDGKLWVTEDDGGHWTDLTGFLPAVVKGEWLTRMGPGHADPKVAYLAVDAHRSGKFGPLLYRTADLGRTWQSVSGDLPSSGPVKVVREDPFNAALLFAGTEFALFASLDRGGSWARFGDLPTVAVDDIQIHPRDRDLVVATHGRSLFIVDDIRPLEELTPEVQKKTAELFQPRPVFGAYLLPGFADWNGKGIYRGENPPEGAILTYWLSGFKGEEVKITVENALGQPVAKLKAAGTPGFGRVSWNLRPTKDLLTEYGGEGKEKLVRAGEYTVKLSYGKTKIKRPLTVTIAEGIETR